MNWVHGCRELLWRSLPFLCYSVHFQSQIALGLCVFVSGSVRGKHKMHAGGRGVIGEIEKQLHLAPGLVQPSKDTLYHFGNTSAASTW